MLIGEFSPVGNRKREDMGMELLFYIISGILYALLTLFAIFFVVVGIYGMFKVAFWIFETLDIENPFVTVYNYLTKKKWQ